MPEVGPANRRPNVRRSARFFIPRRVSRALDRIARTVSHSVPWRKVVVPLVAVALVAAALSLTAALMPPRGGTEQASAGAAAAAVSDFFDSSYLRATVEPTTVWVNFYGLESTFGRQPLPAGAVITAHDPQGVVCGRFVVTQPGRYGLMPVYGDDPLTRKDEGAVPGDRLDFRINGLRAKVKGPDEAVWTEMGDLRQVDVAVQWGLMNRPISRLR